MKKTVLNILCALCVFLQVYSCKNKTGETEILQDNSSEDSNIDVNQDLLQTALLADYEILDMEKGILNSDEFEDLIIVYNKIDKGAGEEIEDERILAIYFAFAGGYSLHAINFKAIGSKTCGGMFGDCYNGIDIKDGYFSINYYGGSGNNKWLINSTFKYDEAKGEFFLHRVAEAGSKTYGVEMDHKEADSFVTAEQFGEVKFIDYDFGNDYIGEYDGVK